MNKDSKLSEAEILIAEFNYAAQTSFQANEDRVKIFNLLVLNIGSIIIALFFTESAKILTNQIIGTTLILLAFIGVLFLMQLGRLRTAWIDSVKSMNKIKDYYIKKFPEIEEAFLWKSTTVPRILKLTSISFLLSITMIAINLITFWVGIYLLSGIFWVSVLFSIFFLILQIFFLNFIYKRK